MIFLDDSKFEAAISPSYPIDVDVNDMQILLDIALAKHKKITVLHFQCI